MNVTLGAIVKNFGLGRFGDKNYIVEVSMCTPQIKPWCATPVYVKNFVFDDDCDLNVKEVLKDMEENGTVLRITRCSESRAILPVTYIITADMLRKLADSEGWI